MEETPASQSAALSTCSSRCRLSSMPMKSMPATVCGLGCNRMWERLLLGLAILGLANPEPKVRILTLTLTLILAVALTLALTLTLP